MTSLIIPGIVVLSPVVHVVEWTVYDPSTDTRALNMISFNIKQPCSNAMNVALNGKDTETVMYYRCPLSVYAYPIGVLVINGSIKT